MPPRDPEPKGRDREILAPDLNDADDRSRRSLAGLRTIVERLTPWLLEVGSWIFGGLIALSLVLMSSLITVGPVDRAVLISVTAFASALPLDVAGVFMLRLTKDMSEVGLDDLTLRSFRNSGFPEIEAYFPPVRTRTAVRQRRLILALSYALGMASLSVVLTMIGLVSALWHMAWWVGVVLLAMILLSIGLVIGLLAHTLPPDSEGELRLKRRYAARRAQRHTKSPR